MKDTLITGDALTVLKTLLPWSVDALITDPPAGVNMDHIPFDTDRGGRKQWIAWLTSIMKLAYQALKPGGHALIWALPRTSHWTATALEDAGFEIRDCLYHIYGSGMPKSLDISKAIDTMKGATREVVRTRHFDDITGGRYLNQESRTNDKLYAYTAPATPEAKKWQGYGTALKPSVECWWLCRKPINQKNVAQNVLTFHTGALNLDAVRVGPATEIHQGGRHPSHLLFSHSAACTEETCVDDCPVQQLEAQHTGASSFYQCFYYAPKVMRSEKHKGCEMLTNKPVWDDYTQSGYNNHPTVKSLALMRYLVRLITPPDGIVLDCFAGSGSTLLAALEEHMHYIGIEKDREFAAIAQARIEEWLLSTKT